MNPDLRGGAGVLLVLCWTEPVFDCIGIVYGLNQLGARLMPVRREAVVAPMGGTDPALA